ncbi:MAG: hypothetical protein HRU17_16995 [Polyangiaceae bacterium]|nr:hypothetical protein [Polyangiaceae bacterium]
MRLFQLNAGFGAVLIGLCATAGCETDAVGVEACRSIELARCQARVNCDQIEQSELDPCERYARDHCLHGIALEAAPDQADVDECVEAVNDTANCDKLTRLDLAECSFLTPNETETPTETDSGSPADSGASSDSGAPSPG